MAIRKNKQENKKNEENEKEKSSFDTSFLSKIFIPLKALIKIHTRVASKELKKDIARYVAGIRNIFIGLLFISTAWLLINVIAILVLNDIVKINNLLYSVSIVAGSNFLIAIILFLSSISKFKQPFLKETKKLLKESAEEFKINE